MSAPMPSSRLIEIRVACVEGYGYVEDAEADLEALLAEVDRLRAELAFATACAEAFDDAIGYIDDYFVRKCDMRAPLDAWHAGRTEETP